MLVSLGLCETAVSIHFLVYLWSGGGVALYSALVGTVCMVLLNLASFFTIKYTYYSDPDFVEWQPKHESFVLAVRVAGLLINFKLGHLLISRLWWLPCCSGPLRSVQNLRMDSVLLMLAVLLFEAPFMAAAVLTLVQSKALSYTKVELMAIEVAFLTGLGAITSFAALFKDQRYYHPEWEGV
jgi:hypothetical protein